ncbi:hypothetical protein PoB_003830400 [Plakobranchus ocellatus]|uniref:Uncharacterized protein n=1 Tax=Plakobranchus ocellatus TaxID=259542 RepID=A0AAV4AZJ0_9GAST|nr:hypothetical protein PoB_003830400 [Plakobranchus ocellatus]
MLRLRKCTCFVNTWEVNVITLIQISPQITTFFPCFATQPHPPSPDPNCPQDANYVPSTDSCVCKKGNKKYSATSNMCDLHCPADADSIPIHDSCRCKLSHKKYNETKNKCDPNCPKDANYDPSNDTCVCKRGSKKYRAKGNTCDPNCPSDADYDLGNGTCVCRKSKKKYVEATNECEPDCPNGADYISKSDACLCRRAHEHYMEIKHQCESSVSPMLDPKTYEPGDESSLISPCRILRQFPQGFPSPPLLSPGVQRSSYQSSAKLTQWSDNGLSPD